MNQSSLEKNGWLPQMATRSRPVAARASLIAAVVASELGPQLRPVEGQQLGLGVERAVEDVTLLRLQLRARQHLAEIAVERQHQPGMDARFAYESRLFYPAYGQMRFATNPANGGFRNWAVDYARRFLTAHPGADGLFLDN